MPGSLTTLAAGLRLPSNTTRRTSAVLFGLLAFTVTAVADASACVRPYSDRSPWNTRIPGGARINPASAAHMRAIQGPLSSDPSQYTYPVYRVSAATTRRAVSVSGWFSTVTNRGTRLRNQRGGTVRLPIPARAAAAAGTDAQLVLVNPSTGAEWGVWRLKREGGRWAVTNGYRYNTRWSGVPPRGFVSRGAGIPYLAGLVRRCEIARGRINHALAFAYDYPSPRWVYPATKSDGKGRGVGALPEGTRLQLNPRLSAARIRGWGCRGPCLTIARALQRYGMYVVDNSGRPKIMLEYEGTARWNGVVNSRTVRPIPLRAFRVIARNRRAGSQLDAVSRVESLR